MTDLTAQPGTDEDVDSVLVSWWRPDGHETASQRRRHVEVEADDYDLPDEPPVGWARR